MGTVTAAAGKRNDGSEVLLETGAGLAFWHPVLPTPGHVHPPSRREAGGRAGTAWAWLRGTLSAMGAVGQGSQTLFFLQNVLYT